MSPPPRAIRAAAAALVTVGALGLVAVAARSGRAERLTPIVSLSPTPAPTLTPASDTASGGGPAAAQPPNGSHFGAIMLTLMGIALVLIIIVLLIGRRRARRRTWGYGVGQPEPLPVGDPDPRPAATATPVLDAVDSALRRLDDGGEPTDAVIACWVLLERAAAQAGTARAPADTSTELVERVLARHQVSAAPLGRLANLYRTARYSAHPLGEDARGDAQRALARVRAELTGETAAAPQAAAPQ